MASLRQTEQRLIDLSAAIREQGLSKSLLAFADRNKALSTAVPSIPAVEAYGDPDMDAQARMAVALDQIEVLGQEALKSASIGTAKWILVIFGLFVGIVPGIILYYVFTSMKKKDEKPATVLKYAELVKLADSVRDIAGVVRKIATVAFPSSSSEINSYCQKLASALAPVDILGIGIKNGEITVGDFPEESTGLIQYLGYTDSSLRTIAGTVKETVSQFKELEAGIPKLLDQNNSELSAILDDKKATDEQKRAARVAASLRVELYQMLPTRVVKALRLVKANMATLAPHYEKGDAE